MHTYFSLFTEFDWLQLLLSFTLNESYDCGDTVDCETDQ